ncbi:MAG: MarR family transcriptional regulator [Rhizobiaceae bacterium]|nr:MAG: MarR family transcriptional regulator [Rhizobiaceae bacterium]CAG0979639.1 HTH-type transcriptional repressor NicR [Rhizobiaceae bacterium]
MSKAESLSFATTIEVRDSCLCLHVQRAARALARRFDEAFRPIGITHGQFSLLMSLNRPQPARMREVSSLLAMDRTTLTANLKPLERRGLVAVSADPADKRGRLLVLTDTGRDLLAAAMPLWRRTQESAGALITLGGRDVLLADLRALS